MEKYSKYMTTVVGSYSVPRWYETIEKQLETGALSTTDLNDAQFRATQAAILDQETAGIDIITGGEMHRRTNNRHALISKINCDVLLIEHDMTGAYERLLKDKFLAVGAADVQDFNVESPEIIAARIQTYGWLPPEKTLITSSCGMNHLPRHIAFGKLQAMTQAKHLLLGIVDL